MLKKGMSKNEIEKELEKKGDFVKIDYLTRFLKEDIPIDMKKFIYLKLGEIYEDKSMFADSAKMFNNTAIISIAYSEKVKRHVKEAELYIKAGFFEKVDEAMKRAMNHANANGKQEIYSAIKNFYKRQAEVYGRELRRNNAVKIYEKLLEMKISESEREEIKNNLLELYDKLGRLKDYFSLKNAR